MISGGWAKQGSSKPCNRDGPGLKVRWLPPPSREQTAADGVRLLYESGGHSNSFFVVSPDRKRIFSSIQPVCSLKYVQQVPAAHVIVACGCSFWSLVECWDNTSPTQKSEMSTLTTKWRLGLGRINTRAEVNNDFRVVKAVSASGDEVKEVEMRFERGAATWLILMNLL